jgi:tetratricopeptide (TPR) repeat protein
MIRNYSDMARKSLERLDRESAGRDACTEAVETAWAIPRFPQLAALHGELLVRVMSSGAVDDLPGLSGPAAVLLVRTALLGGAPDLAEWAANEAERRVQAGRADWKPVASQAMALLLAAQERVPGALARREEMKAGDAPVPEYVALIDMAIAWAQRDPAMVESAIDEAMYRFPSSPEWDGERHDAWVKRALVNIQMDRKDEARQAVEEALRLARIHGCHLDSGAMVLSLVPMLLAGGEAVEAVALLEETLEGLPGDRESAPLEMPIRALLFQSLEAAARPGEAIRSGFQTLTRASEIGTAVNYASTAVSMASMYHRSGSDPDALNLLMATEEGLRSRTGDGDQAEALDLVRDALAALKSDLGDDAWESLVQAVEQRRAGKVGR